MKIHYFIFAAVTTCSLSITVPAMACDEYGQGLGDGSSEVDCSAAQADAEANVALETWVCGGVQNAQVNYQQCEEDPGTGKFTVDYLWTCDCP